MAFSRGIAVALCAAAPGCASTSSPGDAGGTGTDAGTAAATDSGGGSSGSAGSGSTSGSTDGGSSGGPVGPPGSFSFLTYNVAGLPEGLSSSDPVAHMPQISPLLNNYDLAVVQEDFWYHTELSAEATHPHQSVPWSDMPTLEDIGDGLNRFSQFEFAGHERVAWWDCNGNLDCASDCLATKGWSFARHTMDVGIEIDVYNLHNEAGGCDQDIVIRDKAADDLIAAVQERSDGRPVIIAGDFNLHADDPVDREVLERILNALELQDACWSLDCGTESIDRVFFRGNAKLSLAATAWSQPAEFVDTGDDGPLSDHLPTSVTLDYAPL